MTSYKCNSTLIKYLETLTVREILDYINSHDIVQDFYLEIYDEDVSYKIKSVALIYLMYSQYGNETEMQNFDKDYADILNKSNILEFDYVILENLYQELYERI